MLLLEFLLINKILLKKNDVKIVEIVTFDMIKHRIWDSVSTPNLNNLFLSNSFDINALTEK